MLRLVTNLVLEKGTYLIDTYVTCRRCRARILVQRPRGRTSISGNVRVGRGVKVEGSKISLGPEGSIGLGPGGSISFGAPPKTLRVKCPMCSYVGKYRFDEIIESQ